MASRGPQLSMLVRVFGPMIAPAFGVVLLNVFLGSALGFIWLSSACLLSVVAVLFVRIQIRAMWEWWDARRMGAIRPPRFDGKWPGSIDLLIEQFDAFINDYFGDFLIEVTDKLGPIYELYFLWDPAFIITNPEHVKMILASGFPNFIKGEWFQATMYSVLGTGVFNSDGDMWKFHRSITRPFFSRDRISHFEMLDNYADIALNKMRDRLSSGVSIDFQDVISRFTLDSATDFLFGASVGSLLTDLPYPHHHPSKVAKSSPADDFAAAFAEAQLTIAARNRQGWVWPLIEIFKDRTADPMKVVNAYIDPILQEAVRRAKETSYDQKSLKEVEDDETLLDHLVKHTQDPQVLHDEILNIMIAGRDTTAATLTFVTYFLTMYPSVFTRLRNEVLEHVGPSRRPTYDDIKEMKYLRAVINETLRLYPPVPINVRTTIEAITLPNPDPTGKPFYIPAKAATAYSVFIMHRRKEYWGPDAEEFDPDRFLDHRLHKYLIPNPFIFLPFNAGPRICLGQQFAYNEVSFFLIRLLQRFSSIELDPSAQPPESRPPAEWAKAKSYRKRVEKIFPKLHLTMYSMGGLWVKMSEANEGP